MIYGFELCFRSWLGRYLDFVSFDANLEAIDLDFWAIAPGAVAGFESPGVPWAGDDAVVNFARAERSAHVGAEIVDGHVLAAGIKHGNEAFADGNCNALAFGDGTNFCDRDKFGHEDLFVFLTESREAIEYFFAYGGHFGKLLGKLLTNRFGIDVIQSV